MYFVNYNDMVELIGNIDDDDRIINVSHDDNVLFFDYIRPANEEEIELFNRYRREGVTNDKLEVYEWLIKNNKPKTIVQREFLELLANNDLAKKLSEIQGVSQFDDGDTLYCGYNNHISHDAIKDLLSFAEKYGYRLSINNTTSDEIDNYLNIFLIKE